MHMHEIGEILHFLRDLTILINDEDKHFFLNLTPEKKLARARPGFEPGTSRTLSENHTPRPTSQLLANKKYALFLQKHASGMFNSRISLPIHAFNSQKYAN